MATVKRYDRYSTSTLKSPTRAANGALIVEGRISRIGVQIYQDSSGGIRRELRLPGDVFDPESLASFALVPVTNQHPPMLIDPATARDYAVGAVGESVRQDGNDWVAAKMTVWDAAAIEAAERGRSQLSCGYSCELEEVSGTWQGQAYDAIQRNIRGNHLALVDAARAGAGAALRLDENEAIMLVSDSLESQPTTETKPMPQFLKIDGAQMELNDANALAIQQAHDKAVNAALQMGRDEVAKVTVKVDSTEKARLDAEAKASTAQAKLDAFMEKKKADKEKMVACDECDGKGNLDSANGPVKCDGCDGSGKVKADMDPDDEDYEDKKDALTALIKKRSDSKARVFHRAVRERVALEVEARKHLGADAKLDHLDTMGVKREVLAKLKPELKLDGKDAVYVSARYDGVLEDAAKATAEAPSAADLARAAVAGPSAPRKDDKTIVHSDHIQAGAAYAQKRRDAWKPVAKP